jgi:PAS domain S-box-containing protein
MDKYKHFFYKSLDLGCFGNRGGYFEELNENFTSVLGYSSEDLRDKKFIDFVHPDDQAATVKVMDQLLDGINTVDFINRFRTKTNSYRFLEWNSVLDPETNKICAVARDVTGKVIANRELLVQIQEKKSLASELLLVNKELALQNELKAKRAAELLESNTALVIQNAKNEQRTAELTVANLQLAFELDEKRKRANELLTANKELLFQNEEKEKRSAELLHARSTLKKTEEFLREHIVGLEQMLVMTSHGVRQPVASILGIIHLLDRSICSPDEQKKLMEYIKDSALALDMFVKKLTIFMYNLGKDHSDRIYPLY